MMIWNKAHYTTYTKLNVHVHMRITQLYMCFHNVAILVEFIYILFLYMLIHHSYLIAVFSNWPL